VRIAVIDSSPLIGLTHLDLARKLSPFFDVVLVPSAVQREVNRKGRFRYRLNRLYATGFFKKCKAADKANVRLLLIEKLDEGEAEALTQAQERQPIEEAALFFIGDEKRAREKCQNLGLKVVGTVGLLARLNLEGDAQEPKSLVRKLRRDLQFRVSDEVVEEAIAMAAEPI
jgi:predicted nucleic acid-binding protein